MPSSFGTRQLNWSSDVRIAWDFEEADGECWTVLRHEGAGVWRELACWERYERFEKVFDMLRERYGPRLVGVHPTAASEVYLYGDKLSAPATIDRLNRGVERPEDGE